MALHLETALQRKLNFKMTTVSAWRCRRLMPAAWRVAAVSIDPRARNIWSPLRERSALIPTGDLLKPHNHCYGHNVMNDVRFACYDRIVCDLCERKQVNKHLLDTRYVAISITYVFSVYAQFCLVGILR